jgi:hypothetical protein
LRTWRRCASTTASPRRTAQREQVPGARGTYALLEDLEQVGRLEEVGISLQRWALLRDVPME